jgi:mono/diheme cytochrome c family protein
MPLPPEYTFMTERRLALVLLLGVGLAWSLVPTGAARADEAALPRVIDFNRDIRPIFSENCYACHGPDKNKRKAGLRLDTRDGIFSAHDDVHMVVAGKPEESELLRRLTTTDRNARMPEPKSGKRLSDRQIALVRAWIEQGAAWKGHWAYLPPVRPELPPLPPSPPGGEGQGEGEFVKNPIDRFVLAKLRDAGLHPSPEADRVTLIRRLSFDLTGLPPTKAAVDAFVNDPAANAYDKLVERLLASPQYGERMAMAWLDLVRYADSIGYHSDNPMNVSPYRDYVIRAFNDDKRFDQFTVEQLAGDLLPGAAVEQKVASAYNRLLQTTEEGGAQAKEYEAKYAADRVRNVSTVWLGTTMGCCQCHDHKFDPFTMRDFYSLAVFFADVQEAAVGRREAGLPVPDGELVPEIQKLDEALAELRQKMEAQSADRAAALAEWEKQKANVPEWKVLEPQTLTAAGGTRLTRQPGGVVLAGGTIPAKETYTITARTDLKGITAFRLEVLDDPSLPAHGPGLGPNGNFVLSEFKVALAAGSQPAARVQLERANADHAQDQFPVADAIDGNRDTGWAILPAVGKPHTAIFEAAAPLGAGGDTTLTFTLDHQTVYAQHSIGKFRLSVTTSANPTGGQGLPANVQAALAVAAEKRTELQKNELAAYYRTIDPALAPVRAEIAKLDARKAELLKGVPTCLISVSGQPRVVRVLPRGNWLDESGEVVSPAVPRSLPQPPASGQRLTRLALARWIASRDNPLTARVFVNRLWKLYFGQGLSRILDDLGSQGDWPTHPELLDWLAVEFMDSGWDVKHMVQLLVTSGTYRQTSKASEELKERDPYNRLVGRQGRFRLDAETVRDNALAISGLLSPKIGGPSVKPYQPAGYWAALNFPPREWMNDKGESLYRRGLYTHWQRSFLQPSLLAFDAPSREECTCDRARSNIPQQALVLLNDPTYVEASRAFAERIVKEGGAGTAARLAWAFGCALSRPPTEEEARLLTALYAKHAQEYAADKEAARKLLSVGDHPMPNHADVAELAAWTSVARVILNLSETITRY